MAVLLRPAAALVPLSALLRPAAALDRMACLRLLSKLNTAGFASATAAAATAAATAAAAASGRGSWRRVAGQVEGSVACRFGERRFEERSQNTPGRTRTRCARC